MAHLGVRARKSLPVNLKGRSSNKASFFFRTKYMGYNEILPKGFDMWKDKLKKAWDENPLAVIGIGVLAITATAKLIDSLSAAQGRRAYARQVDYRVSSRA